VKITMSFLPGLMLWATLAVFGQTPTSDNPQSLVHHAAAKKIAGNDPVLAPAHNFFCVPENIRADNANAPELEPVKLFDNLYAIGHTETVVHVITTPDGIILIDADRVEKGVVAEGLQKLGLNPANVKYMLIGHGHGDHYAGSAYFQERYGTRVGLAQADWDLMYPANPTPQQLVGRPKKDLVLAEGQPLKLGEVTVTPVAVPGHTPGSLGFIFPVKDGGNTYMAGLFGGTIFTASRITTPGLREYVNSIAHWIDMAKKMKVEVEVQNHPIFDATPERLARLKTRKAGEPHPFFMSTEHYGKFWNIISECMQTEIARRGDRPN
jgi:metallo-beta-lactamase class B